MTINDAMKALAEKLDPNRPDAKYFTEIGHKSPLGFWQTYDDHNYNAQWNPIDFLHSEDASSQLMDAMKAEEPCLLFNADLETWEFMFLRGRDFTDAPIEAMHDHRPTAIFLAALAYWKIPVPEGL